MPIHRHSGAKSVRCIVTVAASLIALVMLLTFPLLRARHFTNRFRAAQTLSEIQRHIFVAQPEAGPARLTTIVPLAYVAPAILEYMEPVKPMAGFRYTDRMTLPRFLIRLKLGSSRKSSPDPLL